MLQVDYRERPPASAASFHRSGSFGGRTRQGTGRRSGFNERCIDPGTKRHYLINPLSTSLKPRACDGATTFCRLTNEAVFDIIFSTNGAYKSERFNKK